IPLEPIERASQDELRALQLKRLKWSLQHAYDRVRHYRERFSALALHPNNLRTLEDLTKFPFTVKDDLRRNYPFGMLAVAREEIVRIHASSGTTGKPTIVGYTRNDIENWSLLMARSIRAAGGRPGQIVLVSYGYGLFTGGLGAHYGAERLGCAVIPMSGGQTEKQVQMITDLQPSIVMMTPSYVLTIADEFARQGLDATKSSLRVGIFGAEPWSESLRTEIETRFQMDALDIYGLSEVMGPGVACECVETKDGLVIWEDHFYPEIIDPETGAVLPDGTYGELVLTSLTKEGHPLIRYRTRDLARLLPPTARSMRRIGRIMGRSDDMLIIRGVNVFPSQIEELIVKNPRLSPHYQLVVSRIDRLDELEVKIEPRTTPSKGEEQVLANDLRQQIKNWVGVTASVSVVAPGSIERVVVGKARRVIDNRPKSSSAGAQPRGEKSSAQSAIETHAR
ncbi:MAG TPA: phenylacetate--CoA ligase PaaK, partial [Chthoniobacterales bacterium]|nr:phenylacetate--CoA ligase PaaK [Chthoniobacterales bacterium]